MTEMSWGGFFGGGVLVGYAETLGYSDNARVYFPTHYPRLLSHVFVEYLFGPNSCHLYDYRPYLSLSAFDSSCFVLTNSNSRIWPK